MPDAPPYSEQHPDKVFCWFDEDGVRCGPRHQGFKAALQYAENWTPLPIGVESPDDLNVIRREMPSGEHSKYKRMLSYPSQKRPHTLRVAEWIVRDLTDEEEQKIETIKQLIEEGLV